MTTIKEIGDTLPELHKQVTQEQIGRYARASGDFNPIHLDPEFAGQSSFGRIVAHGMLILSFLSEMLTTSFGQSWLENGRLKIRFRSPVYPGDVGTAFGSVTKVTETDEGHRVVCVIGCRNQNGEAVISGEASLYPNNE